MYQREKAFLIKAAYLAAVLAVGWLILRYALVWLLPFLLALGFAALMEPAITPVSYTHLDVYKRQAYRTFTGDLLRRFVIESSHHQRRCR